MSEDKVQKYIDYTKEQTKTHSEWLRSTQEPLFISDDPNPYRDLSQSIPPPVTKIRLSKPILSSYREIKDNYTIDECLNCYNELFKKELSEPICIGGAVGLHLQGIIKRDSFHDLDLVFNKIPELDDDIIMAPARIDEELSDKVKKTSIDSIAIFFTLSLNSSSILAGAIIIS